MLEYLWSGKVDALLIDFGGLPSSSRRTSLCIILGVVTHLLPSSDALCRVVSQCVVFTPSSSTLMGLFFLSALPLHHTTLPHARYSTLRHVVTFCSVIVVWMTSSSTLMGLFPCPASLCIIPRFLTRFMSRSVTLRHRSSRCVMPT